MDERGDTVVIEPTAVGDESGVRAKIRAWWEDHIERLDEVRLPAAAAEALRELGDDPAFVRAFFAAFGYTAIYAVGKQMLSDHRGATRGAAREGLPVPNGHARPPVPAQRLTADELRREIAAERDEAERRPPDWARWFERDAASGYEIKLLKMTKAQLLAAAAVREARGERELSDGALLRLLAGRLKADQIVEDRWTPEQITDVYRRLRVEHRFELVGLRPRQN